MKLVPKINSAKAAASYAASNVAETVSYGWSGCDQEDASHVVKGSLLGTMGMAGAAVLAPPFVSIPLLLATMGGGSVVAARDYMSLRRDINSGVPPQELEVREMVIEASDIPVIHSSISTMSEYIPVVEAIEVVKPSRRPGVRQMADIINTAMANREFKFPVVVAEDEDGNPMINTSAATVDMFVLETTAGNEGWDVSNIEKAGDNFARACGMDANTIISVDPNIGDGFAAMYISKQRSRIIRFNDVAKAIDKKPMHFVMGEDVNSNYAMADLDKALYIKIVGMPGSGKTVLFRTIMLSLARSTSPRHVRFFVADPKGVDFLSLKHLQHTKGFAVEPQDIDDMLQGMLDECAKRAKAFEKGGTKSLDAWNSKFPANVLPKLVLAIEELTAVVGEASTVTVYRDEEVEKNGVTTTKQVKDGKLSTRILDKITLLALKYRYVGVRMIIGTQRMDEAEFPGQLRAAIQGTIAMMAADKVSAMQMIGSTMPAYLSQTGEAVVKFNGDTRPWRIVSAFIDDKTDEDEKIAQEINNHWVNRIKAEAQSKKTTVP